MLSFYEAAALAAAVITAQETTNPRARLQRDLGLTDAQLERALSEAEEIGLLVRPDGSVALTEGGAALGSAVRREEGAAKQRAVEAFRSFTEYVPTRVDNDLS